MPGSVKTLLAEDGPAWRQKFQEEDQYLSQIRQQERGEYELTLTVTEQDMDMMRVSFSLPSRELAVQLAERWPRRGAEVYETIIRMLMEDKP